MNHMSPSPVLARGADIAAFRLLREVVPSTAAFVLQKTLGLTYWAYDPEHEEFAWCERLPGDGPGFEEKKADIKVILAKYDAEDTSKLLASIQEAVRSGSSKKYRITMQVDTPRPTVFSVSCVKYEVDSKPLVLGLMRNCEKDMKNEMYILGIRDLLSDFCASSPSGVLLLDNDGAVRDFNEKFAELFGVEKTSSIIGADARFQERGFGKSLVAKLTDALRTKKQFQGRANFVRGDGSVVDLNYRIFNFSFRENQGGIAVAADLVPELHVTSTTAILESILNPLLIFERSTRVFKYANTAAIFTLGIEPRHMDTERLTDYLLNSKDTKAFEAALSAKGRDLGRVVKVMTYSNRTDYYLMRASLDQTDPDARAVLEFLPASRMQVVKARVRALLG